MRLGYLCMMHLSKFLMKKCFNEAEAHAPRIPPQPGAGGADLGHASMRPRRMRLGYNRGIAHGGLFRRALQ